jgi:hypothetical protein
VGSRVLVQEHVIEAGRDLVQNRVKIDRFTGGAYPTALFSEQPVFGGDGTTVRLELELRTHASDLTRRDAEIGLLLLVLKDLWTGDLPIGGESGVGRGRLRGETATLVLHSPGEAAQSWTLERAVAEQAAAGDALADPRYRLKAAPQDLEPFVTAFNAWKLAEKSSGGQHGR